jgi:hypothetical protein
MSQLEHQNDDERAAALTPEAQASGADHMAPADHAAGSANGDGAADDYGADKIKVLEGLEAVRKRVHGAIGASSSRV